MSTNLIVRLWIRFARWSGIIRTEPENTPLSAPIIAFINTGEKFFIFSLFINFFYKLCYDESGLSLRKAPEHFHIVFCNK